MIQPSKSREEDKPYAGSDRHGAEAVSGNRVAICTKEVDEDKRDEIEREDGSGQIHPLFEVPPGDDACCHIDNSHDGVID